MGIAKRGTRQELIEELEALRKRAAEQDRLLRQSTGRYEDLYENAPDMFVSVEAASDTILECNNTFVQAMGYRKDEIIGRPVLEMYHADCHDTVRQVVAEFKRTGQVSNAKLQLRRKDGGKIHIMVSVSAVRAEDGTVLYSRSVYRDVTDLEVTEANLHQSKALVHAIFESALDAIVGMDHQGNVVRFNPAAEAMFGYRREAVMGRSMAEALIPPSLREQHRVGLARYLKTGENAILGKRLELSGMRADGSEFPVELTITRLALEGLPRFVGFIRDITERKKLEQEVLSISIQEQRRIALDLHDGLGQELTGAAYLADTLSARITKLELPEAESAAEIAGLIHKSIGSIRGLVHGLYPMDLRGVGLKAALEKMSLELASTHGVSCRVVCKEDTSALEGDTAVHLYNIAREALNNAIKHGAARSIVVELLVEADRWTLSIDDDGSGIPPSSTAEPTTGMGLRIMRYRADLIGGSLSIGRNPQGGTRVICTLRA